MKVNDEEIPLLRLLPHIHRLAEDANTKKRYGMTKSQIAVLLSLRINESESMGQVADSIAASREQATRTVSGLFDRGYVERFELPENRTHVYIRLTEKGREFINTYVCNLNAEIEKKLYAHLSATEKEELCALTSRMIELLKRAR